MDEINVDAESALLETVLYSSRAMRRLEPTPVPEPLLVKLIDAANQAPSGSNAQQTCWIVVRDPGQKKKMADLNRLHGAPYIQAEVDQPRNAKHKRLVDAVVWQMDHMHEAPALIVACYDYDGPVSGGEIYRKAGSVWPGIQNLLLMARSLGLGAAPTTLALRDQALVRTALDLPETFAALCMIPVGYPSGRFGPVVRKPTASIMRFDRWSE